MSISGRFQRTTEIAGCFSSGKELWQNQCSGAVFGGVLKLFLSLFLFFGVEGLVAFLGGTVTGVKF